MRVYEFAKELGKDSGDLVHELRSKFGLEIKSHLSAISKEQMEHIRATYNQNLLSSLTNLKDELEKQVDDSHKQDLKETFNETVDSKEPEFISYDLVKDNEESKETEELTVDEKLSLGIFSGDDIEPPPSKLDEKAIKKLKKENEKAVQISMKSSEKATKEYAKTVHNIIENPDDWATPQVKNQQEIIIEKPSWWSRMFSWWSGS